MKREAIRAFRRKLAADATTYGLWITLESASVTDAAVALGLDWVVIDAEHGHLDWKDINEHVRATLRSPTVALVRLAERHTAIAKRALDIGADGVVIPWVETAEQLREAIRDCRYPPEGRRGLGGERATVWGQCLAEHAAEANELVLVIPMIESVAAIDQVPAMCRVEGVEVFFFGPADLSSSAGYRGQWEGPGVAEKIQQMHGVIRAAGRHSGVMATSPADLAARHRQGFRMLGLGADNGLLLRSLHQALQAVGQDRRPAASLDPREGSAVSASLPRPPDSIRPTACEAVTPVSAGDVLQVQEGVAFEALAGGFNGARNLTTGIVTFDPGAVLDCHRHPSSEAITVLEGAAEVQVEGRTYRLGPLDQITIPRWLPHGARNRSAEACLRLHVALAMSEPEREPVERSFPARRMPDDSEGVPGFERVTRFLSACRGFHLGSGIEVIDYFNARLIPGIEMSGGWARFEPGGRLPAHLHDFDESICIIRGEAICQVEGRRYGLSDAATAMVPRGRVHYFVNDSDAPMEMIWVYAGPDPDRIVVDERWAGESRAADAEGRF